MKKIRSFSVWWNIFENTGSYITLSPAVDDSLLIRAVPESGCFYATGSSLHVDLNCTPFVGGIN